MDKHNFPKFNLNINFDIIHTHKFINSNCNCIPQLLASLYVASLIDVETRFLLNRAKKMFHRYNLSYFLYSTQKSYIRYKGRIRWTIVSYNDTVGFAVCVQYAFHRIHRSKWKFKNIKILDLKMFLFIW